MNSVTLSELEARTRRKLDVQNNLVRHPQADVWDNINRAIKHFHAEVVRAQGQGMFNSDTFFTTTPGTTSYALPADGLQVVKVWSIIDGRERVFGGYEEVETDGMRPLDALNIWAVPPTFRVIGDNISIKPSYAIPFTVNVRYVATIAKLTTGSQAIDGFDGFDEFVVSWAGRELAMKDGKLEIVAGCSGEIAEVLDRLRATIRARNRATPKRIVDQRGSAFAKHYGRIGRSGWYR